MKKVARKGKQTGSARKKPFRLEAGKMYERRDGQITGVIKPNSKYPKHSEYAFYNPKHKDTYTNFGQYSLSMGPDEWDLIREYKPKKRKKR